MRRTRVALQCLLVFMLIFCWIPMNQVTVSAETLLMEDAFEGEDGVHANEVDAVESAQLEGSATDGEDEEGIPNRIEVVSAKASSHDGNLPENVLDGDLTTRWSAKSVEIDGEIQGEWISFDLGEEHTVSYLGLAFHNGDQRKSRFVLEVSKDEENWIEVFSGESSGTTSAMEAYDSVDEVARYVRFVGYGNTSNNWNSLLEVHVYGPSSNGELVLEEIEAPPEEERGDTTPYTVPGLYEQDGTPHPIHEANQVTGRTLDVTNFGAVANDGLDDMAAIEEALSVANPGDEIYFPNGEYDLIGTWSNDGTSQIVLKSEVNLRGESKLGTILKSHFDLGTTNSKVLRAYAQHDIKISDLTITSTFSGEYSTDHTENNPDRNGPEYGIYIEDSSGQPSYNITIENVVVEKFQKMGIRISKSHDVVVRNATIRNATDVGGGGAGYGISIQGVAKVDRIGYANDTMHNLVENSTFEGPYLRHGIIIQFYAHNNEVRNNEFYSTKLDAIDLHGELEYMNKVYNNTISGILTGAGIALGNTGGTAPSNHSASGPDNYIVNNTITNSREGIKVHMGTPDTLIEGNTIINTSEPSSSRGILIQNGPRTIIKDNKILDNSAENFWGILLESDPGDSNADHYGSGDPQDVVITGNTITGNTNGVRISAGTGIVLSNNVISDNLEIDFEDLTEEASGEEEEWMVHPIEDAMIDINQPDENYGMEDPEKTASGASDKNWYRLFNVKANSDFTFGRIAYMKFDISNIGNIHDAVLELYGRTGSNTTEATLDVYGLVDDNWSEETLTWNESPNHAPDLVKVTGEGESAFHIGTFTINTSEKTKYTVDVSEFVKQQKDNDVTFMIVDTKGQNGNVNIMSKEDNDSNFWPLLRITQVNQQDSGSDSEYPLQFGEVMVQDQNGNELTDFASALSIQVSSDVTNVSNQTINGTMIIALYLPDGEIARVAYVKHSIDSGETINLGAGFDLPESASELTLKMFVWDSLDKMQPLTDTYIWPNL